MNINELFEQIQDNFISNEILNGEFTLQGNCIIWTYNLEENSEEIAPPSEDDEEQNFSFEALSSEELLQEAYQDDLMLLEGFLDEIEEINNWTFSDPEISENLISFKIF
jgi:hypothetical protein